MNKRSQKRAERRTEALIQAIGGAAVLIFITARLVPGLKEKYINIAYSAAAIALLALACVAIVYAIRYVIGRKASARTIENAPPFAIAQSSVSPSSIPIPTAPSQDWSISRIQHQLGAIDWYQFERFCAALLKAEGFEVERKGGAQPDGGVDLVAQKGDNTTLIQCKHWKTWKIQEKTVRELLGSMTHFQVNNAALYILNCWTAPAARFAEEHHIALVDGHQIATRAKNALSADELTAHLDSSTHHCPKCESTMIWRTGNFKPFWGCSTYPRCRGILKHSKAQ